MYILLRGLIRRLFAFCGLGLVSLEKLQTLEEARIERDILINKLPLYLHLLSKGWLAETDVELLRNSTSEKGQDIFALLALGKKKSGTFIEFGAYNGIDFSNTLLLETHFGWEGALIEPIPSSFANVKKHRSTMAIHGAVTPVDQESVSITETPANNLSHVSEGTSGFFGGLLERVHHVPGYSISTIMTNFLQRNHVDFLSVDVEGLEYQILQTLDFGRYSYGVICVEHNNSENKVAIKKLLESEGYLLVMEEFSGNDYWFIHPAVAKGNTFLEV